MSETTETRQSAPTSTNCLQETYSAVSCLVDLVDYLAHKQSNQYEWLASQERRQLCRVHEEMEKLGTTLKSTREQALGTQPRQWRKWDVAADNGGIFLRIAGQARMHDEHCWENLSGQFTYRSDNELTGNQARFLFNLADLLAQGPIVVGLTKEAAEGALRGHWDAKDCLNAKLRAALAACEQQEVRA